LTVDPNAKKSGGGLTGSDTDELIDILKKQISEYKQAAKN
jgi:hypothetical protein